LFVVVQPEADKGVRGDRTDKGVEAGGDSAQAKTSAQGAFVAEMAGEDTEADTNISAVALAIDAAAAPEV
jgi:hypothetical protein